MGDDFVEFCGFFYPLEKWGFVYIVAVGNWHTWSNCFTRIDRLSMRSMCGYRGKYRVTWPRYSSKKRWGKYLSVMFCIRGMKSRDAILQFSHFVLNLTL